MTELYEELKSTKLDFEELERCEWFMQELCDDPDSVAHALAAACVKIEDIKAELTTYRNLIDELRQLSNPDADQREQVDAILRELVETATRTQL